MASAAATPKVNGKPRQSIFAQKVFFYIEKSLVLNFVQTLTCFFMVRVKNLELFKIILERHHNELSINE